MWDYLSCHRESQDQVFGSRTKSVPAGRWEWEDQGEVETSRIQFHRCHRGRKAVQGPHVCKTARREDVTTAPEPAAFISPSIPNRTWFYRCGLFHPTIRENAPPHQGLVLSYRAKLIIVGEEQLALDTPCDLGLYNQGYGASGSRVQRGQSDIQIQDANRSEMDQRIQADLRTQNLSQNSKRVTVEPGQIQLV